MPSHEFNHLITHFEGIYNSNISNGLTFRKTCPKYHQAHHCNTRLSPRPMMSHSYRWWTGQFSAKVTIHSQGKTYKFQQKSTDTIPVNIIYPNMRFIEEILWSHCQRQHFFSPWLMVHISSCTSTLEAHHNLFMGCCQSLLTFSYHPIYTHSTWFSGIHSAKIR